MTNVASRELRNHTAAVLRRVAEGTDVTVTVNGRPVALITQPRDRRVSSLSRLELMTLREQALPDRGLRADLAWISNDTTDDLGDLP